MNLRHIEIFRAIMQTGSTSRAARLLDVSQPTVSNALRQLEAQIRVKLFERLKGRLYPTREAEILLTHSEQLINCLESIEHLAEDLFDSGAGALRLAATPGIGYSVLPAAVAAFHRDRPKVKAGLFVTHYENILGMAVANEIDFGITVTPTHHPNLTTAIVREGRFVCAIPIGHPLAERETVLPEDLKNAPLISFSRSTPMGHAIREVFRDIGELRSIALEVRFSHSACKLVEHGAGVAIVDEFTVIGETFKNLVVRPLETSARLSLCVSYSADRPLSTLARVFFDDYLAGRIGAPARYRLP